MRIFVYPLNIYCLDIRSDQNLFILPDKVGKVDAGGGDVVGVHVVTHITVVLVWMDGGGINHLVLLFRRSKPWYLY